MGKASFAYEDFSKGGGFGLQAGKYELVECRTKVHQPMPNKQGEQSDPFFAVEVDVVKLGDDWKRVADETVIQHQFPVAFTQEDNGRKVLKARPGKADSADDDDPTDLGKDKEVHEMIDLEGNCMVADDGYKPWNQSPWALFIQSLEAKGFKAEVNRQGFTPNYVGMKFSCETVEMPKPKNWKKEQPPTALKCTGINTFPWDVKKGKGSSSSTSASTAVGSSKESGKKSNGDATSANATFVTAVAKFVTSHKGQKFTRDEFKKHLGMDLMAIKEIGVKGTQPLLKEHVMSEAGLVGLGLEHGFEVDTETWTVTL